MRLVDLLKLDERLKLDKILKTAESHWLWGIVLMPFLLTLAIANFFLRILLLFLPLYLTFAVHEGGHYSEMRSRDIPVQDFFLGFGPSLYEYQGEDCIFHFRLIPLGAYVEPTKKGQAMIEESSIWDKFVIYSAGVRNNLLCALGLVGILQFVSALKTGFKVRLGRTLKNFLFLPIRIILIYICCAVDVFTLARFDLCRHFAFSVKGVLPIEEIKELIFWNFLLGFLNFLPLFPLDGSKIALDLFPGLLNYETLMDVFGFISLLGILFIVIFGKIKTEFVRYGLI